MLEVLMGHRIALQSIDEIGPYQDLHFDAKRLHTYLKSARPMKTGDLHDSIQTAIFSEKKYTLLTVDDGYSGFRNDVLPILELFNMPCIIFLTTGFISRNMVPYEVELASIIKSVNHLQLDEKQFYAFKTEGDRQALYKEIRLKIKSGERSRRRQYLKKIKAINRISNPTHYPNLFLSWKDILTMDKHPLISFGAHSVSHPSLKSISLFSALKEIRQSKIEIESQVGHRIHFFSYPYGDHSLMVRLMIQFIGFKYAFTTVPQIAAPSNYKPSAIPRIDLRQVAG